MRNDLFAMYWAQQNADPLPSAYRRVAYLESPTASNRPYIDTGVYGGNSNLEIEIEFRYYNKYNWDKTLEKELGSDNFYYYHPKYFIDCLTEIKK